MSYVVNLDGTYKEFHNLGWLLRHWQDVEKFEVTDGRSKFVVIDITRKRTLWEIPELPSNQMDSVMIARLKDGRTYVTRWASYKVMLDWLHRPKFIGLPIIWFGWSMEIGKDLKDTLKS